MTLRDKLRDLHAQPADGDLADYLGLNPGDRFAVTRDSVIVGDETIPLAEARRLAVGPPIAQSPSHRRSVIIGDL